MVPASDLAGTRDWEPFVTFPSETDPDYAYATPNFDDAAHYARMAAEVRGIDSARVYAVEPVGDYEADPKSASNGRWRGVQSDDVRSRKGWRVIQEHPIPRETEQ